MNTYKVARVKKITLYTLAVVEVQAENLGAARSLVLNSAFESRLDSVEQNASETPEHWWTVGLTKAFPRLSIDINISGDTTKVYKDK